MGLSTTHDCWQGPYSSFGQFRAAIAQAVGYPIVPTKWGGGTYQVPNEDKYTLDNWEGIWEEDPEDVILILLVHADAYGIIPHRYTRELAFRMVELFEEFKKFVHDDPFEYMSVAYNAFVKGLIEAHLANEDVEFH